MNHAKFQLSLLSLFETLSEQSLLEVDARYIGIVDLLEAVKPLKAQDMSGGNLYRLR